MRGTRMRRLIWTVALIVLLMQMAAFSATVRLLPMADTYLDQAGLGVNFGGTEHLELGSQSNANRRILLRFDLSDVSALVTRATLNLYYYWGSGNVDLRNSETKMIVRQVANVSWGERSVTWANAPASGAVITTLPMPRSWGFITFDVTPYLVEQAQGDGIVSLLVQFDQEDFDGTNRRIRFRSKEHANDVDHRPYLEITPSDATAPELPKAVSSSAEGCWELVGSTSFGWGRGQVVVGTDAGFYVFSQWQAETTQNAVFYSVAADGTLREEYRPSVAPHSFETGAAAAWDGSRYIYFLVGAKYSEGRRSALRYDTHLRDWCTTRLPDTPYAQGAGNSLAFVGEPHGSYIYAVVGVAASQSTVRPVEERVSALMRLQVEPVVGASWETIEAFGFCVDDGSSVSLVDDYLYFLHGCDCNDRPVRTLWRFQIPTQSWDKSQDEIPARLGANDGASLGWDGERYVYATVGGANEPAKDASGKEFFRYDTIEQEWETLEDLPCALGSAPGNRLAVIHGFLFLWQGSQDGLGIYRSRLDCW